MNASVFVYFVLFWFRHIFVSATNFHRLREEEAIMLTRLQGHAGRTSCIERKQMSGVEPEFSEEAL